MKKILYLSNIDWNWIKQRPQFIAEGLSSNFEVLVLYQYRYGRKGFQKRNSEGMTTKRIYVIPRFDRYRFISRLNDLIRKAAATYHILRFRPDVIIAALPDQIKMIPALFKGKVLYDCMDDHIAIASSFWKKAMILKDEMRLCRRAEIILCSSSNLSTVICSRYSKELERKITIIRNGFDGNKVELTDQDRCADGEKDRELKLCYLGTISDWFDFDLLLESIKRNEKLHYYLYGPITGGSLPKNSNIKYMGTIEHSELYRETCRYDGFIMPFKINDIVRSVDPVKLYEYINFGKNILCVQYEEVEHFRDFVFFYSDLNSFMRGAEAIQEGTLKYTLSQRDVFLSQNSWSERVSMIEKLITASAEKDPK